MLKEYNRTLDLMRITHKEPPTDLHSETEKVSDIYISIFDPRLVDTEACAMMGISIVQNTCDN